MILTVANAYPSEKDRYNNGFVHARVKAYLREGIEAKAFVMNKKKECETVQFEGVDVLSGNAEVLSEYVNSRREVTCVSFHFLTISMLKAIEKFRSDVKIVIFVHGNEALWWHERIFPDCFATFNRVLKFCKYVVVNTGNILYIRNKINKLNVKANIVCVSEWMKNITVKNWHVDESRIKANVIPNIIDETIFPYQKKSPEQRFKILMLRSFASGKYAADIAMDTIKELQKYPEAEKLEISVFGDGWLFDKYTSRVKDFNNVKIERKLFAQKDISKLHAEYGFFLCPTRQDAQGVSMCEAMSSGLIPISSPNTAIPEFLPESFDLACVDAKAAAARIIALIRDEEQFLALSKQVSDFIRNKCCVDKSTGEEIRLMKAMDGENKTAIDA